MSALSISLYRGCTALLRGRGLRRYRWVNRVHEAVLRRVKSREATVLGHRMLLDRHDSLELSVRGIYEPLETAVAQRLLSPGDCAVDIGANIGYYTLLFARRVAPHGRVYAFEPEPENFSVLRHNLKRNGYQNVRAENLAVSDSKASLELFLSEENRGDHRLYSHGESCHAVPIQAITLDDYFGNQLPQIHLLKMDIQGAEGRALKGMQRLLSERPPRAILMEFWPLGLHRAGIAAETALQFLEGAGYRLSNLDERKGRVTPTTCAELLERYTTRNGKQTNILAQLQ